MLPELIVCPVIQLERHDGRPWCGLSLRSGERAPLIAVDAGAGAVQPGGSAEGKGHLLDELQLLSLDRSQLRREALSIPLPELGAAIAEAGEPRI